MGDRPAQVRPVSIGRVINLAAGAIATSPLILFGAGLLFTGVPQAVAAYFQSDRGQLVQALAARLSDGSVSWGTMVAGFIGVIVLFMLLAIVGQAVMIRATASASQGAAATVGECLSAATGRLFPLMGLALLSALAIGLAMLLLVIPGIILSLMWYVAAPALMIEERAVTESMERSAELTRGARWQILLIVIVAALASFAINMVFSALALAFGGTIGVGETAAVVTAACTAIGYTFSGVIGGVVPTAVYVELRESKEGPLGENLSDIFA